MPEPTASDAVPSMRERRLDTFERGVGRWGARALPSSNWRAIKPTNTRGNASRKSKSTTSIGLLSIGAHLLELPGSWTGRNPSYRAAAQPDCDNSMRPVVRFPSRR